MLADIEQARKKASRKRMVRKIRGTFAYAAVTAAVVFLAFQFFLDQGNPVETPHQADQGLERTEQPVQHEATEEPGAMNHHDSDKEENKECSAAERPPTIEITTYPESMTQTETYYLVQFGGLPFTTYIPENWQAEYVQQNGRFGMHVAAAGNGDFRYGEMDIIFFPQQTSRQEAEKHILEDVIQDRPYETLPRDGEQGDVPAWALQSYVYIDPQQSRTGQIHLGEHNDRLFYFHSEFMDEAGDGWGPRQEIILEHWIWQDTGEPLQSK